VTIGHIYAIWRNNKTIDKPEVPHRMTNEAVSPFLTSRFRHERIAWSADCGGAQYFCWRLSSAGVHCQSDVNKPNLHLITLWLLLFWTAMCWKCIAVIWSKTTSKTLTEDNTTIFYTAMCSRICKSIDKHWCREENMYCITLSTISTVHCVNGRATPYCLKQSYQTAKTIINKAVIGSRLITPVLPPVERL